MIRRFLLLLSLTSTLAAAPRGYIVEFVEAPAGRREAGGTPMHVRFRADLAATNLITTNVAAPSAERPVVMQEYSRVLHGAAVRLEAAALAYVRTLPYVAAVHLDGEVQAFGGPVSANVNAPVPRRMSGGSGVVVAIVDSGVDHTHPALAGKVVGGWDFVNDDADAMDDFRHGTHVAGIIAAEGSEMTGVAPGVTLLAYKVLDARGRGPQSLVIAAIERALDPNADGDPSDRADVINVSLGGAGHAGDVLARAVDNAVAAGVVVCVASGNAESAHAIGSPGAAARAVTVGAADLTGPVPTLASFSSRGPAAGTNAVKPDLVAAGVGILSTVLEHKYAKLSGTSMATPHVAALAALLLEAHPEWTPDQVKSALVSTAAPLESEEVLAQGAGLVFFDRAASPVLSFIKPQIAFGLDATSAPVWHGSSELTMKNESAVTRIVRVEPGVVAPGITLTATPSELSVAPGESGTFRMQVEADHALLGAPPTGTLSFGGRVAFRWEGGEAMLPWMFVRAGRALVTFPGAMPEVQWNIPGNRYSSFAPVGLEGLELLVEPGTYDLAVVAVQDDATRVIVTEAQVDGELVLALDASHAPHELRLETFPPAHGSRQLATVMTHLHGSWLDSMTSAVARRIFTSTIGSEYTLRLSETFVDGATQFVGIAQYPLLVGVSEGRTLTMDPSSFRTQALSLELPAEMGPLPIRVMPRQWARGELFATLPPSIRVPAASSWTLSFSPEVHDDFATGVQFAVFAASEEERIAGLHTPIIRRRGESFVSWSQFADAPLPVSGTAGETLTFGDGATHMPSSFSADEQGLSASFDLEGAWSEKLPRGRAGMRFRVVDAGNGTLLRSGDVTDVTTYLPLGYRKPLLVELATSALRVAGRPAAATLRLGIDTARGRRTPPSITSLAILDGAGRHATRLPHMGNGALVFSASDVTADAAYQKVNPAATHVFIRRTGAMTWVQLNAVDVAEDETASGGRLPIGTVYRVDLADALRFEGEIEVMIEIEDDEGSTAQWQLSPAFVSGPVKPVRRRAVGASGSTSSR